MAGDTGEAVQMAAAAGAMGGAARVLMALHGGQRGWPALALEAGLGATLGVMAAGLAVWWDPTLRDTGWPLLIVGGFAGLAGALGTRALDLVTAALQRRLTGG